MTRKFLVPSNNCVFICNKSGVCVEVEKIKFNNEKEFLFRKHVSFQEFSKEIKEANLVVELDN